MKKSIFSAPVAFILFLFLSLSTSSAMAGRESSPAYRAAIEQSKAEAATLLKTGKAKEAYELYARLMRDEPEDDDIVLGLARSALYAGRPNQAVMAYQLLLEKYPKERVLYEEIGQAYMALGDRETAKTYLDQAKLEDVGSTLDVLEKRYAQTQVHGRLRAGVMFDSNANQGPASNQMTLGNYLIRFDSAKSVSSAALYAGAQVDVAHRLEQSSPWWLVGDGQALWRGNANSDLDSTHSRESQWGRVSGGIRHLDSQTLFDLRLKGEVFDYEFYQRVMALGPEMLFLVAVQPDSSSSPRPGLTAVFIQMTRHETAYMAMWANTRGFSSARTTTNSSWADAGSGGARKRATIPMTVGKARPVFSSSLSKNWKSRLLLPIPAKTMTGRQLSWKRTAAITASSAPVSA